MELQELVSAAIMTCGDARVCEAELGKLPDDKKKLEKETDEDLEPQRKHDPRLTLPVS
jgi:hypothetical protein